MDPLVVSARQVMAEIEKEYPEAGLGELSRWIGEDQRAIARLSEQKWMTLTKADSWLTKLGLSHLLSDGTITVVGNPRWSVVSWFNYMAERGCLEETD